MEAIAIFLIIMLCVLGAVALVCIISTDTRERVYYDNTTGHYYIEISEAYIMTHTSEEIGKYINNMILQYELEEGE